MSENEKQPFWRSEEDSDYTAELLEGSGGGDVRLQYKTSGAWDYQQVRWTASDADSFCVRWINQRQGDAPLFWALKRLVEQRQLVIEFRDVPSSYFGAHSRLSFRANATSWEAIGGPVTLTYDQATAEAENRKGHVLDAIEDQAEREGFPLTLETGDSLAEIQRKIGLALAEIETRKNAAQEEEWDEQDTRDSEAAMARIHEKVREGMKGIEERARDRQDEQAIAEEWLAITRGPQEEDEEEYERGTERDDMDYPEDQTRKR